MEGLAGAKTNMDLLNTPFRVYKDARRRGDLATMERAMGYVKDFSGTEELDENINLEQADSSGDVSLEITVDAPKMEPIIYTKTGIGQSHAGAGSGTSISVSV